MVFARYSGNITADEGLYALSRGGIVHNRKSRAVSGRIGNGKFMLGRFIAIVKIQLEAAADINYTAAAGHFYTVAVEAEVRRARRNAPRGGNRHVRREIVIARRTGKTRLRSPSHISVVRVIFLGFDIICLQSAGKSVTSKYAQRQRKRYRQ